MWEVFFLQIVTAYKPKESDKSVALDPIALEKNRNTDFIPMYPKRVKLPFLPGVEGSDYINATYLQVKLGQGTVKVGIFTRVKYIFVTDKF